MEICRGSMKTADYSILTWKCGKTSPWNGAVHLMLEPGGLPFDFYLQAEGPGIKTASLVCLLDHIIHVNVVFEETLSNKKKQIKKWELNLKSLCMIL